MFVAACTLNVICNCAPNRQAQGVVHQKTARLPGPLFDSESVRNPSLSRQHSSIADGQTVALSLPLEKLNRTLVLFRRGARFERPKISPLSGLGVLLS